MEPFNYAAQLQSPSFSDSLNRGFAAGAAIKDQQMQEQAFAAQQSQLAAAAAQKQQQQQQLQDFANNPNPTAEDYAKITRAMPQLAEQFTKSWEILKPAQQDAKWNRTVGTYAALQNDKPEAAAQILNDHADALENSGDEKEAQVNRHLAELAVQNPTYAKKLAYLNLYSVDPKKATALSESLDSQSKNAAELPGQVADADTKKLAVVGQTLGALEGKSAKPQQVQLAIKSLAKRGVISADEAQEYIGSIPSDAKSIDGYLSQHRLAGTSAKEITQLFTPSADAKLSAASSRYSTDSSAASAANRLKFDREQANGEGAPPMNAGTSGDAFLATLPKSSADQVKGLAEGRMAFPTGKAAASPYWQRMINSVAQYDPSFDAVNYGARSKARADLVAGKTGSNIKSINTAIAHIGQLDEQMSAMGNSRFGFYNKAANYLGNKLGNEDLQGKQASVEATAEGVAGEMAKVFRDTGMSAHEIDAWRTKFTSDTTPAAQRGTMQSAMHMLQGRMDAIQDQYNTGMGTTAKPLDILTPDSKAVFGRLIGKKKTAAAPIAAEAPIADGWTVKVHP